MNKIDLPNTILYAKGWYDRSDDVEQDLIKCIEADGYAMCDKSEIAHLLFTRLYEAGILSEKNHISRYIGNIDPKNTWRCGYYTNKSIYGRGGIEYNYDLARIYASLSIMQVVANSCYSIPENIEFPLPIGKDKKKRLLEMIELNK